jgi:hypothetical protein
MALSIGQIAAVSYPDVLLDQRKAANQWAESSVLNTFEEMGFVDRRNFGEVIQATLDYRRNPGAKFLTTDLEPISLAKTEVVTAAEYAIGQLSIPAVWSMMDDVKTPSENAKIAFVKTLLENAIQSHDDLVEEALFDGSGNFLGLDDLIPTSGQGSPGGIPAATEAFWRNPTDTYLADGSDIDAVLTDLRNNAMKGSRGQAIKLLVSGSEPQALWESGQNDKQRFQNTSKLNSGFTELAFKNAVWVFSQYGGTKVYGIAPRHVKLAVSKGYFRHKGDQYQLEDVEGNAFRVYSALQLLTNNKSRTFVADEA